MPNTFEMALLKLGGNWDLYQDQKGWIWYIATPEAIKQGCKSGYWGNAKHYQKMYGKTI